ncbi:MAG: agmatinase [Rhodobacteraceae bacterium]|nr:agmatinase [Paracoccaceae bacterium]
MALQEAKNQVDRALTRDDLRGLDHENAFGGVTSFLRRCYSKDLGAADLAITGIPFDQAVTNRPGARFGPRAIREASALQTFDPPYGWGGFSPLEELAIVDYGDMAFDYAQTAGVPALIQAHITGILASATAPVTLGGDHSITLPILRAFARCFGPMALIQVDAHTDTWPECAPGARIDHGTFLYTAVKEGLIDPAQSAHVGIRTVVADNLGITILDARAVHEQGPAAIAARVRQIVGAAPVYLSFDIDGLDPAFAPGTGTPVWGGLTSGQAAIFLRDLAGIDLKGGDVVEVSPPYDPSGITAVAAAHVAMELMCLWGWLRRS